MTRSLTLLLATLLAPLTVPATPVQTLVIEDFEGALPPVAKATQANSSSGGDSFSDVPVLATESGGQRLKLADPGGGYNGSVVTLTGVFPEPGHYLVTADIKVASTSAGPIYTYGMAAKVGQPSTAKVLDGNAGYVMNLVDNPTNGAAFGYQTIGASVQVPAGGTFPKDLTLYFGTDPSGSPASGHSAFGDFSGSHRGPNASLPIASNTSAIYVDNIKRIGPGNFGEERHAWISVGDGFTNLSTLNNHIQQAYNNGFNCIDILVRYRTNRYYNNNRDSSTYLNNEPNIGGTSDGNDPIQYAIDRAHELGMRVYGSFSCFLATDGSSYPSVLPAGSINYIYNSGSPIPQPGSGLWTDPGRADVRAYTINIAMDIVQNYDLDGIIFDRIRYDDREYGYNPQALLDMGYAPGTVPAPTNAVFMQRRRDAITTFLHDAYEAITDLKPWMVVGTVPVAYGTGMNDTYNHLFQSWPDWSAEPTANRVVAFGAQDLTQPQFYRQWSSAPVANQTLMTKALYGDLTANSMDFGLMPGANTNVAPLFYTEELQDETDAVNTANAIATNICDTQTASYYMNGNGVYNVSEMFNSIVGSPLISRIRAATTPCGPDVMMPRAPLSDFLMKEGYDNTPPNPVTATANNSGGLVTLNWDTPAPAEDGEVPTRYLVYRSTSASVPAYYATQLAITQTISGNSYTDGPFAVGGTYYYRVVAVDDYNNKSTSVVIGPYTVTAAPSAIVESRTSGGGLTPSPTYVESAGAMADTTSKSGAPGVTAPGSRYGTTVNQTATFRPNLPSAGGYDVFVTLDDASSGSNNNALTGFTITGSGSPVTGQVRLVGTDGSLANTWKLLASDVPFAAGTAGTISFKNLDGDGGGALTGNRFVMDAVKFQLSSTSVDDWQLY